MAGSSACPIFLQKPGGPLTRTLTAEKEEAASWLVILEQHGPAGVHHFFSSALLFDWCLFSGTALLAVLLRVYLHDNLFVAWVLLASAYASLIYTHMGEVHAVDWTAGYLLELVFLVENIFMFQVIAKTFQLSSAAATQALHIVVWGQILFEAVFFMGLAEWLRTWKLLPYFLGLWLLYLGFSALFDNAETLEVQDESSEGTPEARWLQSVTGDRISLTPAKAGSEDCFVFEQGRWRLSLFCSASLAMLLADFLLEMDAVLTKIEEIPNSYVAFTSSALAAFAIPEIFKLSQDLLALFPRLRQGMGLVLLLFGLQMLMAEDYVLPPIAASFVVLAVLASSVLLSVVEGFLGSGGEVPTPRHALGGG